MNLRSRTLRFLAVAACYAVPLAATQAQDGAALIGDYICQYGCRLTDALPSVAIDGDKADCMNELGGIFHGRRLNPRSIACFNQTGVLSADGKTLTWTNGEIWEKHARHGERSEANPRSRPP
jgi:hypothetical protein